ncbi:uncharacterized protein METZ01_LOCUS278797, partial [marine metagenome]
RVIEMLNNRLNSISYRATTASP